MCEIEISHMGKNNGNPDLVCDKKRSVWRITVWHHKACRVLTNGDQEGRIFLSHAHTNNEILFLYTIKYHIFIFKKDSQKLLNMLGCNI